MIRKSKNKNFINKRNIYQQVTGKYSVSDKGMKMIDVKV